MRDGLGIALACNDLDWTRVWQVARRNCTVGRMVGVAAIGDAWLYGTPRWVLAQTRQEVCDRLETTVMRPSGTRENKQTNKQIQHSFLTKTQNHAPAKQHQKSPHHK
jgi:hypothetical protein